MAYSGSINESNPAGSQNPNVIDNELRNLARDIRERVEDAVPDFDNDGVDPKLIDPDFMNFRVAAKTPILAPSGADRFAYTEAENGIYVSRATGNPASPFEWQGKGGLVFGTYNGSLPPGLKAIAFPSGYLINLHVTQTAGPTVQIDLAELSGNWQRNDIITKHLTLADHGDAIEYWTETAVLGSTTAFNLTFIAVSGGSYTGALDFYLSLVLTKKTGVT